MAQKNNFKKSNFYGTIQIVNGDIHNHNVLSQEDGCPRAKYTPEPIWRSPITMAGLTWAGFIISLIGLLPIYKLVVTPILHFIKNGSLIHNATDNNIYLFIMMIIVALFFIVIILRSIAKYQTRYPLIFNYAVSGMRHRLTLEKMSISPCPQCGGKMRYYNKPTEWINMPTNGGIKRKVTKFTPALECRRNSNHWYEIDPAEDKI
ncbi:hypothetical protein [Moraxella marmotae]|uniref:hypothetical protein n=1 Tax=Moraxella marmotae TaxID=3344520 RepID=UPI0035F472EE